MTNKTPYELRFELLKLAKDTLEVEYHSTTDIYRWQTETHQPVTVEAPQWPGKDKIFALAEEYKQFIEQK